MGVAPPPCQRQAVLKLGCRATGCGRATQSVERDTVDARPGERQFGLAAPGSTPPGRRRTCATGGGRGPGDLVDAASGWATAAPRHGPQAAARDRRRPASSRGRAAPVAVAPDAGRLRARAARPRRPPPGPRPGGSGRCARGRADPAASRARRSTSRPCSPARRAVISEPERSSASTTTTPRRQARDDPVAAREVGAPAPPCPAAARRPRSPAPAARVEARRCSGG